QISGTPGVAVKSSTIKFSKIARQEPLSSSTNQRKKAVHAPMPIPQNLQAPGEQTATNSANNDNPEINRITESSPAPAIGFPALADDNSVSVPDTHGAVGRKYLMVTTNSEVRVQNRAGEIIQTVRLDNFWKSLGALEVFGPKAFYDPYAQRWIITAGANAFSDNSSILIGVTKNDDPTGTWFLYRVDADSTHQVWADYPSVGFNKDRIVIQSNMYNISSPS